MTKCARKIGVFFNFLSDYTIFYVNSNVYCWKCKHTFAWELLNISSQTVVVPLYSFCKILFYFHKSKQAETLFQQNKILDINCEWREEYEILQNITKRKQSTNIKISHFSSNFFSSNSWISRLIFGHLWFNGQERVRLKY